MRWSNVTQKPHSINPEAQKSQVVSAWLWPLDRRPQPLLHMVNSHISGQIKPKVRYRRLIVKSMMRGFLKREDRIRLSYFHEGHHELPGVSGWDVAEVWIRVESTFNGHTY